MEGLAIPTGSTPVEVGVIDTTARLSIPAWQLLSPTPGLEDITLTAPTYSFFIKHPSGRTLLFDLGLRKDWWKLTPNTAHFLKTSGWRAEVTKNVSEILQDNGINLADIEAVIWSHHHFDHVGDVTTFPDSTKIIVGPAFKEHYLPAYPTNPKSTLLENQWENRELYELAFDQGLNIGGFDAIDYFGDGSFYILDAPGHTHGHIAALARTTAGQDASANTFVLMGGDTCHFAGQLRPTKDLPLPLESHHIQAHLATCPGAIIDRLRANSSHPLFEMPKEHTVDVEKAHASIHNLQAVDSMDNVLVMIAHDESLLNEIPFYPAAINDWRQKGYGERVRWRFLDSLEHRYSSL
ncbi:beta-lactamase-like protein [Aspergillus karnatakaensis]|uniref:MBL fold metallo-hydrolase n=1 Tax=Aspergillus karnatakaensis TaxID=1810916 RepID=UPI003CCD0896